MRPTSASTVLLLALASLATSANVYIDNYCSFPIFVNFILNPSSIYPGQLNPGQIGYTIAQPAPGGANYNVQVSTSANQGLVANPLEFQFSPNVYDGTTYYSFSTVLGDPFAQYGFEVLTDSTNPPDHSVVCEPRTQGGCCQFAFTYPGETITPGVNLFHANPGSDFTFRLCRSSDP